MSHAASEEALPKSAEVVVIGGGIAGCMAANTLAAGGAKVIGIEARHRTGDGFSGRALGRVSLGLDESPFRLASALGDQRARELYLFSSRNRARLANYAESNAGGTWLATREQESEDILKSYRALERIGIEATLWSAEQCAKASGYAIAGPGWHDPKAFCVNPKASLQNLAQGAQWYCNTKVVAIEDEAHGLSVRLDNGAAVHAEFVVVAAGTETGRLLPSFSDCFTAVRESWMSTPAKPNAPIRPFRGGHGYMRWRDRNDGTRVLGGLRWAVPHMGVGDTDDSTVAEKVRLRLQQMLSGPMGLALNGSVQTWSAIACHSCDNLPIIGAIPGHGRKLICAGWGGADWAFAAEGAFQIAQSILTGQRSAIPSFLSPARLLE